MIGASIRRRLPSPALFCPSSPPAVVVKVASGDDTALFRSPPPPPPPPPPPSSQLGVTLLELQSSLVALVTSLATLLYHLGRFVCTLLRRLAWFTTFRLIKMCLIETYLQMANLEPADLKRLSLSNGSAPATVSAPAPIDDNNNKSPAVAPAPTPTPAPAPTPPKSAESAESCKDSAKTPPNTPAPGTLSENFKSFAKFGDIKSSGEAITLSNSDKWFKQAKIIDGKKLSTVDTGIYWKQVAKTKKSLTLSEYTKFLDVLAKMKKLEIDDLKEKLSSTGPPVTNKTTSAGTSGAFGRLTDHTKYTGSHKQRFDESGKGRGKAGREDMVVNTGYVTGFKA